MIANAARRAMEGKYDDAVARLYRSVEMVGQIAFENEFKVSDGDVKNIEVLPQILRKDFRARYTDPIDGKIKLPLQAKFEALNAAEIEIGKQFKQNHDLQNGLRKRNGSILAHGINPVQERDYESLNNAVMQMLGERELPVFPKLDF